MMDSYIAIHKFMPKKRYPTDDEIRAKIDEAIVNLKYNKNKEKHLRRVELLKDRVFDCMKEYNKLTGVTDNVIKDHIRYSPNGLLPQYVDAILSYFVHSPSDNKEINILQYSGIEEIKIRYKHADSVIKKLVKTGFNDIEKLEKPLDAFLKDGLLHDLIGIQFICDDPYQAEWLARALYHFFKIPNRTDDHLIHGFYKIDRESGYKGLHCDKTYWTTAFDKQFIENKTTTLTNEEIANIINNEIEIDNKILSKFHENFNIEIQIHTGFQNLWAKKEHKKSYDILAKGVGKNEDITALWKMTADNLSNTENQFQELQVKTEQSIYQDDLKEGYGFISKILEKTDNETLQIFDKSVKIISKLREKLKEHEIARIDYVEKLREEIKYLENYIYEHTRINDSATFAIKLQIAFIYYSFANHRKYFNDKDIGTFLKGSVKYYDGIIDDLCNKTKYSSVSAKDLMIINAVIRYGRLTQKYGLGLINKCTIEDKTDLPYDIDEQNTTQEQGIKYIGYGLHTFINLNSEDIATLKNDSSSFFRTVNYLDKLSRDIELSNEEATPISGLEDKDLNLNDLIIKFRKKYMTDELCQEFIDTLDGINNRQPIKNTGFIISFLSTLIINKLAKPIDMLERIVNLSSHDSIKASDIFMYEYASYMFSFEYKCEEIKDCIEKNREDIDMNKAEHHGNYHYENMINLLFRIKKEEDIYEFIKARTYFNKIEGRDDFKEDYLSSILKK